MLKRCAWSLRGEVAKGWVAAAAAPADFGPGRFATATMALVPGGGLRKRGTTSSRQDVDTRPKQNTAQDSRDYKIFGEDYAE